ncbi:MAG: GNAT family N-acetyltransferase [Methylomicrobium sp.]|nr:GNAT family N-acetyltransferase [Methylomicrobium sp.]
MKIYYDIVKKENLKDEHRNVFSEMLQKQGKVKGNMMSKADRCKMICIAKDDSKVVSIGAIKRKTDSDFSNDNSGLEDLADQFEWELGYLFTENDSERKGFASTIVRLLIDNYGDGNLMASTEISKNPVMVKILEKNGFRLFGRPWKSNIHENYLGLFLKFK